MWREAIEYAWHVHNLAHCKLCQYNLIFQNLKHPIGSRSRNSYPTEYALTHAIRQAYRSTVSRMLGLYVYRYRYYRYRLIAPS